MGILNAFFYSKFPSPTASFMGPRLPARRSSAVGCLYAPLQEHKHDPKRNYKGIYLVSLFQGAMGDVLTFTLTGHLIWSR